MNCGKSWLHVGRVSRLLLTQGSTNTSRSLHPLRSARSPGGFGTIETPPPRKWRCRGLRVLMRAYSFAAKPSAFTCRAGDVINISSITDYLRTLLACPGSAGERSNLPEDSVDRLATLALEHFLLKMRPLNRALRCAVKRQASQAAQLVRPDIAALCVTDDQVQRLLSGVDDRLRSLNGDTASDGLTPEEQAKEAE